MTKNSKRFPTTLPIIIAILFLLIGALQFYVRNVSRAFIPYGKTYQFEQSTTDEAGYTQTVYVFVEFNEDGLLNIIATDKYFTTINKSSYDYRCHAWNNIGNLYFKTDSLLSATIFKEDARPVTLEMECVQSRGFCSSLLDEDTNFITYENTDEIGACSESEAWFYENSLVLDGVTLQQIDAIDPVCKEMVRLFIDSDDIFAEYLLD